MCGDGPQEAVSRSMDIDRDRMTVEFASKVADLGNWDLMERILFSHKTMTVISSQNLYGDPKPDECDDMFYNSTYEKYSQYQF